jgi:hypothetical protein
MYIIYDCEGTPIGTLTENAIRHTTVKEDLGSDFIIVKVEDYKWDEEDD